MECVPVVERGLPPLVHDLGRTVELAELAGEGLEVLVAAQEPVDVVQLPRQPEALLDPADPLILAADGSRAPERDERVGLEPAVAEPFADLELTLGILDRRVEVSFQHRVHGVLPEETRLEDGGRALADQRHGLLDQAGRCFRVAGVPEEPCP